jgi:hypothetical protein
MTDVIYKHSCVDELRMLLPAPSWTVVLRVWDELWGHQDQLRSNIVFDLADAREKAAREKAAREKAEEKLIAAETSSCAAGSFHAVKESTRAAIAALGRPTEEELQRAAERCQKQWRDENAP